MSRVRRILAVTGGLMVTGAIAGALAAAVGVTITAIIQRDVRTLIDWGLWRFTAGVGALVGGIVAPVCSWLFLRHVPLGKLVMQTTLATTVFGGVGFALHFNPFIAAPLGFLLAAGRLAVVTPRTKAPAELPPDSRDLLP